jgi:hypothetical protein
MNAPIRCLVAMLLAAMLGGCSEMQTYSKDRVYDFIDMVDFKYGFGADTLGLGAKLEVSTFIGLGLGYGQSAHVREWYGRRSYANDFEFAHALAIGFDGPTTMPAYYILAFNTMYYVPLRDVWRVGGEVFLPFANVGVYGNAFEIVDFVAGIVTLDPAEDDGVPIGAPVELTR